ncbi:hypothetical protein, partial [Parvibaculum sp.]|uniref:hypothetical protein n=1 Tax=Parvibaculum sp. TaxID=2024848 RepID=UPI0025F2A921
HALAAQNLNLPKLRDDLVGLVSLVCHCGPPSWSKPYFKVDPFNGGGSPLGWILVCPLDWWRIWEVAAGSAGTGHELVRDADLLRGIEEGVRFRSIIVV